MRARSSAVALRAWIGSCLAADEPCPHRVQSYRFCSSANGRVTSFPGCSKRRIAKTQYVPHAACNSHAGSLRHRGAFRRAVWPTWRIKHDNGLVRARIGLPVAFHGRASGRAIVRDAVQCRLSIVVPLDARREDHVTPFEYDARHVSELGRCVSTREVIVSRPPSSSSLKVSITRRVRWLVVLVWLGNIFWYRASCWNINRIAAGVG